MAPPAWLSLVVSAIAFAALHTSAAQAQDYGAAALPSGAPSDLPSERVVRVKVAPPNEPAGLPFQMGFQFMHYLSESGSLAYPGQSARSIGLHFVFREGRSIRQHFAFAHHWEKSDGVVRQGFRIDLLSLGFPVLLWDSDIRLEIEPILRPVRGQILFQEASELEGRKGRSFLRFESGFALGLRASRGPWFMTLEPLSVDFRTIVATRSETRTGFSRIWSMAYTLGRDF